MQDAIITKHAKPTAKLRGRIRAENRTGFKYIWFSPALSLEGNHLAAKKALIDHLRLPTDGWHGGRLYDGRYCFVRVVP